MNIKNVNLKTAMAKANIDSITKLSKVTNISRHSLTKYCTIDGIKNITFQNLIILCNALNCRIEDIIELEVK